MSNQTTQPTINQVTADTTAKQFLQNPAEYLAGMLECYRSSEQYGMDILPVAQNELGEVADILLASHKNCQDEANKKLLELAIQKVTDVYIAIQYGRERIDELLTPVIDINSANNSGNNAN